MLSSVHVTSPTHSSPFSTLTNSSFLPSFLPFPTCIYDFYFIWFRLIRENALHNTKKRIFNRILNFLWLFLWQGHAAANAVEKGECLPPFKSYIYTNQISVILILDPHNPNSLYNNETYLFTMSNFHLFKYKLCSYKNKVEDWIMVLPTTHHPHPPYAAFYHTWWSQTRVAILM